MIDISNIKAPGWQRVVAELNSPAPSDQAFLERLIRILAQVSAARQAALHSPDKTDGEEVNPRVELVFPPQSAMDMNAPGDGEGATSAGARDKSAAIEFPEQAKEAARAAFMTAQARAFGLDKQEVYYDAAPSQGYLLAIPLVQPMGPITNRAGGGEQQVAVNGVVTLLIEPRGKDAVRSTLAMAEVLAGYIQSHAARVALKKTQTASFALDLATRLIASINTATNFKGACIQLVNDLAKQFHLDRVALGWVKGDTVKVQAMSDVEHFDQRLAMVQKLAAAMDECLDQEQPVLFPQPASGGAGGDVLLSQSIVHAHRELASGQAAMKVCSLPVRADADVVGVVTLELSGDGQIDLGTIELLQSAMDLVGPVLKLRRQDDRTVFQRAYYDGVKAAGWVVGPKHTVWKLASVAVFALAMFVTFYHTTYRPGAEATVDPRTRRIVSVPFDGQIAEVMPGVEPGKDVKAGDVLVELDTTELRLGLADAAAKIEQARTQIAAAQREGDQGKVRAGQAQMARAIAEADLYRERLRRSSIVAPIDGRIIAGELKDKIGASVKLGETLLQVADVRDLVVTARVDESDIKFVRDAYARSLAEDGEPATGEIATKANPSRPLSFRVERIVPLAQAGEGKNTFEVRGAIEQSEENLAKLRDYTLVVGMEGEAKFNTERKSLLWIGTRKILDTVRLWVW